MKLLLSIVGIVRFNHLEYRSTKLKFLPQKSCSQLSHRRNFFGCVHASLCDTFDVEVSCGTSVKSKDLVCDRDELVSLPHIQNLQGLSKEELVDKVVMVRFDSTILLQEGHGHRSHSLSIALDTIKYLLQARARVILVSDWNKKINQKFHALEYTADYLSAVLNHRVVPSRCTSCAVALTSKGLEARDVLLLGNLSHFKEEVSNSSMFAETLSSGADIFVNDSISQSHKVLASTVGVTCFCSTSVAGFHFERNLFKLKNVATASKRPYFAIIGGGNLVEKLPALKFLASVCDGLVFVGMMSFQIMHALGLSIPLNLLEGGSAKEALELIKVAKARNASILCPKDFWCMRNNHQTQLKVLPFHGISEGWVPVDIGPASLDEINALLTISKKVIWIGPVQFKISSPSTDGASELGRMLTELLCGSDCDVTVVGSAACKAMFDHSSSDSALHIIDNASVFWEFLKGRKLPGVMALDKAYPFKVDWTSIYRKPAQPLVVDIGSGNGLFLLRMANKHKDLNFLGLEINEKLVKRCLLSIEQSGLTNGFFIATNATSTFRSIVSTYPGKIILVSVQCPNPDFNKPEHRWRMLQQSLVEAIADLLGPDGKVFLQSDVEAVAVRMKEQFLKYGKGKLLLEEATMHGRCWLLENPFGVRSDWEEHVLDCGSPMYRLMLSKLSSGHRRS